MPVLDDRFFIDEVAWVVVSGARGRSHRRDALAEAAAFTRGTFDVSSSPRAIGRGGRR